MRYKLEEYIDPSMGEQERFVQTIGIYNTIIEAEKDRKIYKYHNTMRKIRFPYIFYKIIECE